MSYMIGVQFPATAFIFPSPWITCEFSYLLFNIYWRIFLEVEQLQREADTTSILSQG